MLLLFLVVLNMHEILTNQMHELEMTTSYCWLSAKFMAEWNLFYLWLYTTPKFHRIASYEKRLPLWTNLPSRGTLIMWLEQWKAYRLFKTTLKYLSNKYDCIGSVPWNGQIAWMLFDHSIVVITPKPIVTRGSRFLTINFGTSVPKQKRKASSTIHFGSQFEKQTEFSIHVCIELFKNMCMKK